MVDPASEKTNFSTPKNPEIDLDMNLEFGSQAG